MLEMAKSKKTKSIVFFSSSEIYGDPDPKYVPIKESYHGNVSSIGPRSCYDESKRLGETLCITYFDLYKLPIKIIRPFNVYGPGMKEDDYRVIPAFMASALRGKIIPVHSSGKQTRAYCYISDAIIGFLKVLLRGKDCEAYNIGNDRTEVTVNTLAQTLNGLFDNKLNIGNVEYPKDYPQDEPKRRCPDLTKSKRDLSYHPEVDLKEGLKRTLDWCRSNWV
jgi:UDP-glucuronate decarboxylase